ncbi:MAG: hypothetical protein ACFHHU_13730 [Porticoccaceae bacterium]
MTCTSFPGFSRRDQSERPMIHRRAEGRMQELTGEGLRERIAEQIE